jgi:ATP adenylyltransferase
MSEEKIIAQETLVLKPGMLWARIQEQTKYAIASGALQSIPTDYELMNQAGIDWLVRILANLARKDEAKKTQVKKTAKSDKEFNPFLPYEPDLFVCDISPSHLCLLNKFNVVEHHLLIVTREFEHQENWLTFADFLAMWACLDQLDGLVFYNGGKLAGASQKHKHLQIVPLPLVPNSEKNQARIPIEPLLSSATFRGSVGTIADLPFVHGFARLDPAWVKSPVDGAAATWECYRTLLSAVGLLTPDNQDDPKQSGPYNLLATKEWMLIVPRSQEYFHGISVNSLGFAGALLVRNAEQMQLLKQTGPMSILQNVAIAI